MTGSDPPSPENNHPSAALARLELFQNLSAAARKLLQLAWAVVKQQHPFDPAYRAKLKAEAGNFPELSEQNGMFKELLS